MFLFLFGVKRYFLTHVFSKLLLLALVINTITAILANVSIFLRILPVFLRKLYLKFGKLAHTLSFMIPKNPAKVTVLS